MLGGQTYANNSVFLMTGIGEDNNALICVTDHDQCCQTFRAGEWYYPNNTQVSTSGSGLDFYRNRGPQAVRLNRRNNAVSPTGRYQCRIPDASGALQTLIAYIIGEFLLSKDLCQYKVQDTVSIETEGLVLFVSISDPTQLAHHWGGIAVIY